MADDVRISPDTRRANRLPPGQTRADAIPVRHLGAVPPFDSNTWNLSVFPAPLVRKVTSWNWAEFRALPRTKVFADYHCASGVSVLNNLWEGVSTGELLDRIELAEEAKFVMVHAEFGYTANFAREEFFDRDCLFAFTRNGADLKPEEGAPMRLIAPKKFGWKGVKWVRGIEFLTEERPGFWEDPRNGEFPMRGDVWAGR